MWYLDYVLLKPLCMFFKFKTWNSVILKIQYVCILQFSRWIFSYLKHILLFALVHYLQVKLYVHHTHHFILFAKSIAFLRQFWHVLDTFYLDNPLRLQVTPLDSMLDLPKYIINAVKITFLQNQKKKWVA